MQLRLRCVDRTQDKSVQNTEWCNESCGWDVKLPAYFMFTKSAFVAFAAIFLARTRLPEKSTMKIDVFTVPVRTLKRELADAPIWK
jgi:hypothetical protein